MSSRAKKVQAKITEQRINTVIQVLAIMQNEAEQMSFFQRLRISNRFLWKKNIEGFFELAEKNKDKKNAKEKEDIQNTEA